MAALPLACAPRTCTLYAYHNDAVAKTFQDGLLYVDSDNLVQWQCGESWTSWHGKFNITDDQLMVWFDCLAGQREGPPRPKSTIAFLEPSVRYLRGLRLQAAARHHLADGEVHLLRRHRCLGADRGLDAIAGVDADRLSLLFRSARSVDITVSIFRSVRGAVGPPPPPLSSSISSLARRFWASSPDCPCATRGKQKWMSGFHRTRSIMPWALTHQRTAIPCLDPPLALT